MGYKKIFSTIYKKRKMTCASSTKTLPHLSQPSFVVSTVFCTDNNYSTFLFSFFSSFPLYQHLNLRSTVAFSPSVPSFHSARAKLADQIFTSFLSPSTHLLCPSISLTRSILDVPTDERICPMRLVYTHSGMLVELIQKFMFLYFPLYAV